MKPHAPPQSTAPLSPALLVEAGAAIVAASLSIRILPFRMLARGKRIASRPGRSADIPPVVRAVRAWSRRLPWRTMCFEEGLAVHWMLRRRRIASTLHYGAATVEGELKAHVWIRSGDTDVIGCEIATDYALLARFPAA